MASIPGCHPGDRGSNPGNDISFVKKFFLCLCFTTKLIPKSRNLYLSTPMDDFSTLIFMLDIDLNHSTKICIK